MPTYTYECDNCNNKFEVFQHFSEDALKVCPRCKQMTLRKVYSPVGIVFKGSGFYATDHRSPSGMTSSGNNHDGSAAETEKKTDAGKKAEKTVKTESANIPQSTAAKSAEPVASSK
ncbi:MAG: FmdB family transcriptional regulator [Flexilinea flocculi]|jgi:putative FmdB family regulatory protein|nr:FmdB family transcriptional regulator [Flexilinea flocculi]